ncbi:MAG: two-component system response regulator [Desulfuromonas sp.]|nr:MAG: two-component system response regulator [Desulfuromonas sp.]
MTNYPALPVLLVDDEREWLRNLSLALLRNLGINNVTTCVDSREVMPLLSKQPVGLAILDMTMPYISGHELLLQLRENHPEIPVIILTGRNEIELAVTCMRDGAHDYFIKTEETDRLFASIKRALELNDMRRVARSLKQQLLDGEASPSDVFSHIITQNARMRAIFNYIKAIAVSREPVLITGESGVGKELMAEAVHRVSAPQGPWVPVNVAGLDDNAFSDTLFGHVKGAFTGADKSRTGLIEKASGGVLFLDEIGDLEPLSQVKLLRFIQDGEYYPLGSDQPKKAKARLVFATNHCLNEQTEAGTFRRDLFYRLQTHQVELPALRERPDDIPLLFEHFLSLAASEMGREIPPIQNGVFELLKAQPYPGNVRELRALAIDTLARHSTGELTSADFGNLSKRPHPAAASSPKTPSPLSYDAELPTIKQATHDLVRAALAKTGGNLTAAARILGISQPALSKRLKNMDDSSAQS